MPAKLAKSNQALKRTKSQPTIVNPVINIKDLSLTVIPDDVNEGFEERINSGIPWTLLEEAAKLHREMCLREEIPHFPFSEALAKKIDKSIMGGFFKKNTGLTFDNQLDFNVAVLMWDVEQFGSEEEIFKFSCDNCITDDLYKIIKNTAPKHSVEFLREEIKKVMMLRIFDSNMTHFDSSLLEFQHLKFLNLCGNYIKYVNSQFIPSGLEGLELQANGISTIDGFIQSLPATLLYLGLSRNLLTNDGLRNLSHISSLIAVLDLSDNDIYDLGEVLKGISKLPNLTSLYLAGNPCAACMAYSKEVIHSLRDLKYLDGNEIDRSNIGHIPDFTFELQCANFYFTVLRVISAPIPPKLNKGSTSSFYVEVEFPLLDSVRRKFLMYRRNESLTETLPLPEDEPDTFNPSKMSIPAAPSKSMSAVAGEQEPEFNIYDHLSPVNTRIVHNYTIFESNKIAQWAKIMTFQDPTVKILCPDLTTLRNTFRSQITFHLVYSVLVHAPGKSTKKASNTGLKSPDGEYKVTLASVTCDLRRIDWKNPVQQFSWDDTITDGKAVYDESSSLSTAVYSQASPGKPKAKDSEQVSRVRELPENLTIHVAFGIEML